MNSTQQRILIADDEPLYLRTTGALLEKAGYHCVCVPDAHSAIAKLREETFDLVLSDLNMPGNLKLEFLHEHSESPNNAPIIVVTGVPSVPTAIESIRLGITDYLLKPVKFEDLLGSVRRALALPATSRAYQPPLMRDSNEWTKIFPNMIGCSLPMLELYEIIDRVAGSDTNILITGESGTGKEVVAKTIHNHSHRRDGMCQVIDCTAIPESLFESMLFGHKKGSFTGAVSDQAGLLKQCDGGTAFFDELGELPLPMQAKLLRAVQEQTFTPVGSHTPVKVSTRFICATNRDLQMEVNVGRFRQDLFYRLGVIHIDLPPLRQRGDDIIRLTDYYLQSLLPKGSPIEGFTPAAMECLCRYAWPGNIRELRNVIERTIALTREGLIDVGGLPSIIRDSDSASAIASVANPGNEQQLGHRAISTFNAGHSAIPEHSASVTSASRDEAMALAEYQYLVNLLKHYAGNVSEAARQAGMSRQGLHKLLSKHGLQAADFRR
ncbi:MAG TPA: sigma-54-dependent Fis family transcriptional regulator [Planctomycetaceae bacterium]|nr:sigma-54-dependent Fis family transcriptional regulator [Planctomycetaceae bacterium]